MTLVINGVSMPQANNISILCVDDDELFLDVIKQWLEREPGFSVTTAQNSADALERLDAEYFDVIISDYAMPEMDGLSLLKEVRARGCQSLFVMMTAKRLAHIAIDAINCGADYYIQKGSDTSQEMAKLINFIKNGVPKKNEEHELAEWERFYESVIETQPDIICRISPDGTITFVNETGIRFFKKSYEEILAMNFFSLIHVDDRPQVTRHLLNLSAVKPDVLLEHRILKPDAGPVVFQWSYHGFFLSNGTISQYQAAGRAPDSLIRIGAPMAVPAAPSPVLPQAPAAPLAPVAAVPEEPADWKGLIETVQTLDNPVFAVDKAGTIIAWNKSLEQLTGISASAMIGKGKQEYATPFYGKPAPMLIDHIIAPPGTTPTGLAPIKKVGDTYIGDVEHVKIKGKPMLLWGKGSPVYDAKGKLIAAIEAITVGEPQPGTEAEDYLGGISSITLKVSGEGMGGAIAGAIGSSTGGFGVYATNKRMFIIRNPDLNIENAQGVQFGTFIMDELFGTTVDTRQKSIADLEKLKIFEAEKENIAQIELKKPVLLSGFLTVIMKDKSSFRIYIDHKKAFTHIEQLIKTFSPGNLKME